MSQVMVTQSCDIQKDVKRSRSNDVILHINDIYYTYSFRVG